MPQYHVKLQRVGHELLNFVRSAWYEESRVFKRLLMRLCVRVDQLDVPVAPAIALRGGRIKGSLVIENFDADLLSLLLSSFTFLLLCLLLRLGRFIFEANHRLPDNLLCKVLHHWLGRRTLHLRGFFGLRNRFNCKTKSFRFLFGFAHGLDFALVLGEASPSFSLEHFASALVLDSV